MSEENQDKSAVPGGAEPLRRPPKPALSSQLSEAPAAPSKVAVHTGVTDGQYDAARRQQMDAIMDAVPKPRGPNLAAVVGIEDIIQKYSKYINPLAIEGLANRGLSRAAIMSWCENEMSYKMRAEKATMEVQKELADQAMLKFPPRRTQRDFVDDAERMASATAKLPQESQGSFFEKMMMWKMMEGQDQPQYHIQPVQPAKTDPMERIEDTVYNMIAMKMAADMVGGDGDKLTATRLEEIYRKLMDEKQQNAFQKQMEEVNKRLDTMSAGGSVKVEGEISQDGKILIDPNDPIKMQEFMASEGVKAWNRFNAMRGLAGLPKIDPDRLVQLAETEQMSPDKVEEYVRKLGWKVEKPPTTMEQIAAYVDKKAEDIAQTRYKLGEQRKEEWKMVMELVTGFTDNLMAQLAKGKGQSVGLKLRDLAFKKRGGSPVGGYVHSKGAPPPDNVSTEGP